MAEPAAASKLAVVLFILLLGGSVIALMIRSERRDRENKLRVAQSLGFSPADPTPELVRRMTQLYHSIRVSRHHPDGDTYELEAVSKRRLPDGDIFIFDLINNSGAESSHTEKQAVAIVSALLNLPVFMVFPKADIDGVVPQMGNKFLGWVFSKIGHPIEFPQAPEFARRYLVSSPDPDGTRQFLNEDRLHRLAQTRLININAGGDMFTVASIGIEKPVTQELMRERVDQAMEVLSIFLS